MDKPRLVPVPARAPDRDTRAFHEDRAVDILARTIYGEARGEGKGGMEAVANVIMNRVAIAQAHKGYWWGNDIFEVCRKPYQFSCWNTGDANFGKIVSVTPDDPVFMTCVRVARRAVLGFLKDGTNGATHYHARGVFPAWADGRKPCAVIGRHIFYKLAEV